MLFLRGKCNSPWGGEKESERERERELSDTEDTEEKVMLSHKFNFWVWSESLLLW